jgi:hypothetical protein
MPSFVSTAEAWWSTVPHGQHQARGDLGVGQAVGYQGEDLPLATGRPRRVGPRRGPGAARHLQDRCRAHVCWCATPPRCARRTPVVTHYLRTSTPPTCRTSPTSGPELTRGFRGIRKRLPLHLHGVAAFRAALDEKLDLAQWV